MRSYFLSIAMAMILAACGGSEAAPEPTATISPTPTTIGPATRPTSTLIPAPVLTLTALSPKVPPVGVGQGAGNSAANNNGQQDNANSQPTQIPQPTDTPTPTVMPTPTVTPTPTVRPSPTPRWRPAPKPTGAVGYKGFEITSGPTVSGSTLRMSAVIDGHNIIPSEVQVWQSLRLDDHGGTCPTEKPIALIGDGVAGGTSHMQWEFCSYIGAQPLIQVDSVPWISGSWSYSTRPRRRTTDPYTADWAISASLFDERVEALEYNRPEGYIIAVFAGNLLLAKVWIDY